MSHFPSPRMPRRTLLRLAAVSFSAAGLASCGLLPEVLPQAPAIASKPVTLNLYYGPFFVASGGQSPEGTLMTGILQNYHKVEPNVTVNAQEVSFQLFQNIQALTDPTSPSHADVLISQFLGSFRDFNLEAAVAPIDAFLKREKDVTVAGFYPAGLHLWWRNGKQLGLPRDIQPSDVVYYNRSLLKQAGIGDPPDGWTTDDFLAFLQKLSQAGQGAPATSPQHWAYLDLQHTTALYDFISIFGGRQSNFPQSPPRAMFDTSQAINGATFYASLYTQYHVAAASIAQVSAYSMGPLPEFLLGHVPLMLAPTSLIPTMQSVQHPLDWDLTVEPIRADVKQSWSGSGVAAFMMQAATDQDVAWNLLKYLVAGDGMKQRAGQGDVHPAYKKIAESSAYLTNKPPLGKRLFNTIGMTQMIDVDPSTLPPSTPVAGTPVPGTVPDYQAMNQEIRYDLDDVLSGKMDPATMMQTATQKANSALLSQ